MKFCKSHRIVQQYTVPHTPQQNGVAERKNRTLVECARSMLQGKGMSNSFWAEAINTAVYLKNRSPTRYLGFKTPFEDLYGFKPVVNHLRVFGSKAFAHIPKADRKKLDPKEIRCIFVGYGTEFKAYKLFNPESRKTFASRDVVFHEQVQEGKDGIGDDWHIPLLLDESSEDEREQKQKEEQKEEQGEGDNASPIIAEENKFEVSPLPRRSGRKTQNRLKLRDYALMSNVLNIVEPTNYKEASQFKEWRAAMNEEMESILRNDTWDLVELPKNKTPIGCKSLFKPKMNANRSIEKLKARLVAKGYSRQEGIDFDDTFAPVAKLNTIRMLIALATKFHWELHQLDVKSAFLNGDLKEEIYLVQPEGFVKQGQEHLVCRLKKALYGLKQAPRSWYEKVDSFFLEYGFHRSLNDPNLYTRGIKRLMAQVFEMKDLRSLHYCLGLEVCRDTRQTFLTQGKYARNLLENFGMDQCRSAATPLQQNLKLSSDDGTKEVDATKYRQLVGSLIYLTTTKPDLAYFVSVLSQFMSKPLESHWVVEKSVLRYLCGTVSYGILYTDAYDVTLEGFSDSDWASNLDDRKSITGYAFSIGSGVIAWSSKKQSIVALLSCEAEYQALCAATCEAIWLRRLLNDAGQEQKNSTSIKSDNQSTIKLAHNPVFHKSTKHIDTQLHFIREKVQSKKIIVEYCKTCDNVADIFTKPLARVKFELFRGMLGVQDNPFSIKGGS
eukprot:PITA_32251